MVWKGKFKEALVAVKQVLDKRSFLNEIRMLGLIKRLGLES